ncbi:MAG: DUF2905 domain-containing protein [Saprospirales bacterium]|nr:MAG: DUF2905 domain-containing protein [Saprospirales bacterium]
MGKLLIILGIILIAFGLGWHYGLKLPSWVGRLPGDIHIERENFSFYFPLTTSILVSILLMFILFIFRSLGK